MILFTFEASARFADYAMPALRHATIDCRLSRAIAAAILLLLCLIFAAALMLLFAARYARCC